MVITIVNCTISVADHQLRTWADGACSQGGSIKNILQYGEMGANRPRLHKKLKKVMKSLKCRWDLVKNSENWQICRKRVGRNSLHDVLCRKWIHCCTWNI